MWRRMLAIVSLLLLVALVAAACGDDEDEDGDEAAGGGTTPAAEGNRVEVSLTEFNIDMPATLPPGPTTFVVTNDGTVEHNFEVEGQGIEEEFDENLQPGETKELTIDLQTGTYEVYCPVGNHKEEGMELELAVQ